MEDIVERALRAEDEDGTRGESTGPGGDRDLQVAVVGVGATGVDRLAGIGRRLGAAPVPDRTPDDVDLFGVDLPGEEATVEGVEPAGWHTVERLESPPLGDGARLPSGATERLRGFVADRIDPHDTAILAVDGTDRAAVTVASNLAATFRGGPANPTFTVPTFPADDPPGELLAADVGPGSEGRDRFGPDAVVPVEHGRATELAAGTGGADRGSGAPRPPEGGPRAVERAAEAVTAALAGALATGTRFGCVADELHHLRGRVVTHVGRQPAPDDRLDADPLVEDAVATPLAAPPEEWTPGGPWLSNLRTPSRSDASVDAVQHRVGETLADRTGIERENRPAAMETYRVTTAGPNELFLFRVERRADRTSPPDDPVERAADGDHHPVVECGGFTEFEADDRAALDVDEDAFEADPDGSDDEGFDGGLDVVR